MCKSVKFDGETFRTVSQLAKKVSLTDLVWHKGLSLGQLNGDLHYCLCGLDVEATAKRLGLVEVEANRDPMCREFATAPGAESPLQPQAFAPRSRHASSADELVH